MFKRIVLIVLKLKRGKPGLKLPGFYGNTGIIVHSPVYTEGSPVPTLQDLSVNVSLKDSVLLLGKELLTKMK